jgi:peptidoglycan/LPS O-acetylase OafA/YrhL
MKQVQPRIPLIARWHVLFGLAFAVFGMAVGIYMAISQNHVPHPAHAHIMLLGFVVSVIYGVIYRLWPAEAPAMLATVQTVLHQIGATVLSIGLLLLFGGAASEAQLEPLLATGSFSAIAGAIIMLYQVVRAGQAQRVAAPDMLTPGQA